MSGPGAGVRVYFACGVTDMRKGIGGLAALAQQVLHQNPASGAIFAFQGRRGDRIKLLMWDGQGFCLYYKVLERGHFPTPRPAGRVSCRDRIKGLLTLGGRRHFQIDAHRLVRPGRHYHPSGRQPDPRRG